MKTVGLFLITCIMLFCYSPKDASAQGFAPGIPDSMRDDIAAVKPAYQDTMYYLMGTYYYSHFDQQSLEIAANCYLASLKLAEKYKHEMIIVDCYFAIGSVHDAARNYPMALKYYRLSFDKLARIENPMDPVAAVKLSYTIGFTATMLHDTSLAYKFTDIITGAIPKLKETNRENARLMAADLMWKTGRKDDFIKYYEMIPEAALPKMKERATFPIGRMYAEARSHYLALNGHIDESVKPLLEELQTTKDSLPLLHLVTQNYAVGGRFQEAYEYQQLENELYKRKTSAEAEKDIKSRLLAFDNELKEKDNKLLLLQRSKLEQKNNLLFAIALLLIAGLGITGFAFRKIRRQHTQLQKQHLTITEQHDNIQLLFKEVHHRVKNNLQIISSLIELQQTKPAANGNHWAREIQTKMQAISMAHQMMYEQHQVGPVPVQGYFEGIVQGTLQTLTSGKDINWSVSMKSLELDLDRMVPLALIVNELLVNTLKYALPVQPDTNIQVAGTVEQERIHISYTDNGPGLPAGTDATKAQGLGLRLIRRLARQMRAELRVNSVPGKMLEYIFIFEPGIRNSGIAN